VAAAPHAPPYGPKATRLNTPLPWTQPYYVAKLRQLGPHKAPSTRTTIAYARVSTSGQKDDLVRQVALLESFCAAQGWTYEVISDVGSGLNYHKRGLKQLISRICSGEVGRLVLTHKDRLLRFGAELVFSLCEHFGTEVVIINASEESSFEEDLAQDVIEIVTVFSARLYGSRSHKNKQVMELRGPRFLIQSLPE